MLTAKAPCDNGGEADLSAGDAQQLVLTAKVQGGIGCETDAAKAAVKEADLPAAAPTAGDAAASQSDGAADAAAATGQADAADFPAADAADLPLADADSRAEVQTQDAAAEVS